VSLSLKVIISLLAISLYSCSTALDSNYAKLSLSNSVGKKTFSFAVDEEFLKRNIKSKPSALYSKMSVAELKLLMKFLRKNKYCINKSGDLSFKISSRQERIYDVTFSELIEQNYNAKPVSPVTYFGECIDLEESK
jgi:hypothetical protein